MVLSNVVALSATGFKNAISSSQFVRSKVASTTLEPSIPYAMALLRAILPDALLLTSIVSLKVDSNVPARYNLRKFRSQSIDRLLGAPVYLSELGVIAKIKAGRFVSKRWGMRNRPLLLKDVDDTEQINKETID